MHRVFLVFFLPACYGDLPNQVVKPRDLGATSTVADAAAGTLATPCDILNNAGCADGFHCTTGLINDEGADFCEPDAITPIVANQPCQPIGYADNIFGDYCEAGTVCAAAAGVYRCRSTCFRHVDCPANSVCAVTLQSPTTKPSQFQGDIPLSACIVQEECDPVAQTGCAQYDRCGFSGFDGVARVTFCAPWRGMLPAGAECSSSSDCAAGVMCAGLGFCEDLCLAEGVAKSGPPGTCPDGYLCTRFAGSGKRYGRCEL